MVAKTMSPQPLPLNQILRGSYRLIKPHILIDCQHNSRSCTAFHQITGLLQAHGQGLLGQNTPQSPPTRLHRLPDDLRLHIRWHSDVQDFQTWILEQVADPLIHRRDTETSGHHGRRFRTPRSNRQRLPSGLLIGHQMAIPHDEAGPDTSDPPVRTTGQFRLIP
jgi:hypothetical protein